MYHYNRQRRFDSLSATSQTEDAEPTAEEEEDSLLAAIGRDNESKDEPIDLPLAKRQKHSEETSHPLIQELGGALAHFASWMDVDRLSGLDMNILDNITRMCAASPQQQHNQIAVACRRLNVAWRRMQMPLLKKLFSGLFNSADMLTITVLDIMDTLSLDTDLLET